ncbi:MliC family protein [Pseudomonas chlororaphis]|uniref:C-type lysozyme inhibitor domain-containing protein n=1 Tax=Pseudomonas chlororaphis TaxID=587753 RepID=A0A1Q8ENN1_9PSED|nr:MliC family protein [Pseudomonas chlororaphis]OLF53407.1 hypothetical protein BTN82_16715 [Pseudomonas chlororaphis]
MRAFSSAICFSLLTNSAIAATISIDIPGNKKPEKESVSYTCGKQLIKADYINSESTSLVVLTINKVTTIAANVVSASGSKYMGDGITWWAKGDNATLYQFPEGSDVEEQISCHERK